MALLNHSDYLAQEKQIKQHEIVAGPVDVTYSLRALRTSDI